MKPATKAKLLMAAPSILLAIYAAVASTQVQPHAPTQVFDPATGSYSSQIVTLSGNGRTMATVNGPLTPGDGVTTDANGNLVDTGSPASGAGNSSVGTCSMSGGTSCTITLSHSYTTPVCIVTQQGGAAPLLGGTVICSVSGSVATITAAGFNSATFGALVSGNPS